MKSALRSSESFNVLFTSDDWSFCDDHWARRPVEPNEPPNGSLQWRIEDGQVVIGSSSHVCGQEIQQAYLNYVAALVVS